MTRREMYRVFACVQDQCSNIMKSNSLFDPNVIEIIHLFDGRKRLVETFPRIHEPAADYKIFYIDWDERVVEFYDFDVLVETKTYTDQESQSEVWEFQDYPPVEKNNNLPLSMPKLKRVIESLHQYLIVDAAGKLVWSEAMLKDSRRATADDLFKVCNEI